MNKVNKPILPSGESEYDRRLNSVLERWNYDIAQAIGQAADGYVHETTSVATSYTASINDSVVIVNSTSGSKTVYLKAADQCKNKRIVVKKGDASANVVIIEPNGSELIDNVTAYTISATYGSIDAVSDGTKWWVV
jgi:hypothetical protein